MFTINLEFFCAAYLTGLIWTIQRVHYPSFKFIGESAYKDFQDFHMKRITYVVGPIMLLDLGFNIYNLILTDFHLIFIINLILVASIWLSTVLWTVPLHKGLMLKKELTSIDELVISNSIRAIFWTFKSILLLYYLYQL